MRWTRGNLWLVAAAVALSGCQLLAGLDDELQEAAGIDAGGNAGAAGAGGGLPEAGDEAGASGWDAPLEASLDAVAEGGGGGADAGTDGPEDVAADAGDSAADSESDVSADSPADVTADQVQDTLSEDSADVVTDAPIDSPPDAGIISASQSLILLSGTGVTVGGTAVATLVGKNGAGKPVTTGGDTVVFGQKGGGSVLSFGASVDLANGSYTSVLTGVTVGTPTTITATVNGIAVTTALPTLRVVDPVVSGMTFWVDAAKADKTSFGGKSCPGAGLTTWSDLSPSGFTGALQGFSSVPCGSASGWAGTGTVTEPYRLSFDGVDDFVGFGAVNALEKHTVLVWARKAAGKGTYGTTGNSGIPQIFPLLVKGAPETEVDDVDENFYLGIRTDNTLGSDFEQSNAPAHANNPFSGTRVMSDDTWYMVGMTFDHSTGTRVFYIDGAPDATQSNTNTPAGAALSLMVLGGANRVAQTPTAQGRFGGDIAIAMTYDRALSSTEVASNCHAFSSRFGILACP